MPFLRRRGVMASETDMRRHTLIDRPSEPRPSDDSFAPNPSAAPELHLTLPSPSGPELDHEPSHVDENKLPPSLSRPPSPPIQDETPKHRRFSMLRFRNASDSQLSARAKQHAQAEKPPPLPRPPEIITTAPTVEFANAPQKKPSRLKLSSRIRRSSDLPSEARGSWGRQKRENRKSISDLSNASGSQYNFSFDEPPIPESSVLPLQPDRHHGAFSHPRARLSESERSDVSFGDHRAYTNTPTTAQPAHTASSFFRLPRRKQKQPEPLFSLSHLPQKSRVQLAQDATASNPSLGLPTSTSMNVNFASQDAAPANGTPNTSRPSSGQETFGTPAQSPTLLFTSRANASPATALFRPASTHSAQSSPTRMRLNLRGRSSTMSSVGGRDSIDDHLSPPTGRSSISTGRKSFGDLLGLNRFRQTSDQLSTRHGALTPLTPGSNTSKNNSLQLPRESVVLPERRDDDTPAKYLVRLEEVVSRNVIASALSKGADSFSQAVLRSYMRRFTFFGDPMDMAIRKLLMEAELPKETQQIDRCLQAFANRYHECNPGVYSSPDQAYFIAFSLLILHTDVFNKNNKYKMQKADYLKNTHGEGVFDEILECFYDNITYTPFIHVEDDLDINGERAVSQKAKKKSIFPNATPDTGKKGYKEPIDPYALILDKKLELLRPSLKDVMHLDDHYSYLGTANALNLSDLQKTFFRTGVLQIISARSRPDAFMTEKTANNPEAAHPGIVDIKITKVGLLWRKDAKKKKTRSPWQEWGAILTGAQLYFFRNTSWVKSLLHQYENHVKQGNDGIPCIFKPPLEQFKPDALISTEGAVALRDTTYKKHKHAFVYVRQGGFEEVLLADDEEEMNDWLAKLNYAAAFRTSGVRMRGVVGGHYEGQSRRGFRRLDSSDGTQSVQTPTGEVMIARGRIDQKMAQDILAARRDIMKEKIVDAEAQLAAKEKELAAQLQNARHLQILAPIQAKTREQVLLAAGKMAASLKWSRMEIWRLKCHRDILQLDLEEESKLDGFLPDTPPRSSSPPQKLTITPTETKTSTVPSVPRSPHTPSHPSALDAQESPDSPDTEIFQTPPTSATAAAFHQRQLSLELSPAAFIDTSRLRNGSVSSAASSLPPVNQSRPETAHSGGASEHQPEKRADQEGDEVDAGERDLLKQAGLLDSQGGQNGHGKRPSSPNEKEDPHARRDRPGSASADKGDKGKIRRSLQRTLRESAGHLSHHRTRRGRDSISGGTAQEEGSTRTEETLVRGSGSFVVHGKKASVINFGAELQSISPEGRLRQRRSQHAGESLSDQPTGAEDEEDFQSVVWDPVVTGAEGNASRDRRESAASASTATARSFRELHRKYSQAARSGVSASGLVVPSDDDSDAAISFSDGRRTPLPPIEPEESPVLEEAEEALIQIQEHQAREENKGKNNEQAQDVEEGEDSGEHRIQFFTPEGPGTPIDADDPGIRKKTSAIGRPMQPVGA